ncbi:hypothetical protein Peur_027108 [Populus x canadensis]
MGFFSLHFDVTEINGTKEKVSMRIISPYQAQVHVIQEKIGKFISNSDRAFSASVGTVDGFQGGERRILYLSPLFEAMRKDQWVLFRIFNEQMWRWLEQGTK